MKKLFQSIITSVCLISTLVFTPNQDIEAKTKNVSILSEAACVMEVQSGTVLYDKDMKKKEYPASITKILTSLVAIENSSTSEMVKYTDDAFANWESGASNIEIVPGEKISMEESLYAIMLASANEACNGVAAHVAGSIDNFVAKMNEKAASLGCVNSHFANTNGLWKKDHYTCPYDMALIGRAAIQNDTFRTVAGTKYYTMSKTNKRKKGYVLSNHHKMINPLDYPQYEYEFCEGGKTGYTFKCKNTLVTFAKNGDLELVCVVMRCDAAVWQDQNAYTDTIRLLNHCFQNYEKTPISDNAASKINEEYIFTKFSPFFSATNNAIHIDEDAGVILPKGVSIDKAEKKVEYYNPIHEENGKKVIGRLSYTYEGNEVGSSNIYYDDSELVTLKDSLDMSEWFDEAVETANQEPFPWKKMFLIIILVLCVGGVSVICFIKVHGYQIKTENKRRYKRNSYSRRKKDRDFYTRRW